MEKRKLASLFLVALMVLGIGVSYVPSAQIKLVDREIEGFQIPGLFYVNPPTEDKWVNIEEVAPDDRNLQFNPFGVREIRFLLNYLVDRQFIVQDIYEGSAEPMFLPILPASGAYPLVSDIVDLFNLAPTQQLDFFFQEYNRVLRELNETYKRFGYALVFRTDPSAPAGKWLYFRYPDGTEQKVVINGLIRQEDERLYIGQQVARWIEQYMYIDVNEIVRDRILIRIWYGSDLVNRIADIGDVPAHFYTEGWITTAEDPIYWERYTVAFFYGPLLGYNPNHRDRTTWYYFNETLYNLTQKLWAASYFPGQEQELLDDMWLATYYGLAESIRVWLVSEKTFYPVYQPQVKFTIHGSITGMATVWPFRTIKTADGTIKYLQFSSAGVLFASPWNPVMGFTDIYTELVWRHVRDFAMFNHPSTGVPTPIRAEFTVDFNPDGIPVPDDAIFFDPIQERWVTIAEIKSEGLSYIPGAGQVIDNPNVVSKVTFDYILGPYHDGQQKTLADLLGAFAFLLEWAFNDESVTGEPDPKYEPRIESAQLPFLELFRGFRIVDSDTLEVYIDYADVAPELIAGNANIWGDTASIPIALLAGMEAAVLDGAMAEGGVLYWEDRFTEEPPKVGIDMLKHPDIIVQYVSQLTSIPYIEGLPISFDLEDAKAKIQSFYETFGHVAIGDGPYYVESYDPTANIIVLKKYPGYPVDFQVYVDRILETTPPEQIDRITFGDPDEGQFVEEVVFGTVTSQETGILEVGRGNWHVFLFSQPLGRIQDLPSDVIANLGLIPSFSTYADLGLNPTSNVYATKFPVETTPPTTPVETTPAPSPSPSPSPTPTETAPPTSPSPSPSPSPPPEEEGISPALIAGIVIVIIIVVAAIFLLRRS